MGKIIKRITNKISLSKQVKNPEKQRSETFAIGILLAAVGGYLDAYTYICRGHIFANAQTGNIVLLGIKIANQEWQAAAYYIVPIAAFFCGIVAAAMIRKRYKFNKNIHWRQIIIVLECIVLFCVAFIPMGIYDTLANVLVSFVCSLQVESFRKMNGNEYSTTMCTGNLRSATEHLYNYKQSKDKKKLRNSLQYYGIILFFVIGAAIGSLFSNALGQYSIIIACIGLCVAFVLMIQNNVQEIYTDKCK